jgi:hypothetical protein
MDESLRVQIDTYLPQLDALIRRGRHLRETLAADPSDRAALVAYRAWQQDVGVTVNQLSGGSKAHWLARGFSEAFLVRSSSGQAVEGAAPAEIASRLVHVLEEAVDSLAGLAAGTTAPAARDAAPAPRRFEFVHNRELRPVLERAFSVGQDTLAQGKYSQALAMLCGILETIVTDALEHKGVAALADAGIPEGKIADWPFETRLQVAESTGIMRGGWTRLPEIARKYREFADLAGVLQAEVSERDARRTMQVLHVVMRDLDPGR